MSTHAKPAKILRSAALSSRALWAAHLLPKIKNADPDASIGDGVTLNQAAERLTAMCYPTAKTPTPAEAYTMHRQAVLNMRSVLGYEGCSCCGTLGKLNEDHDFPWDYVKDFIRGMGGSLSQDTIGKFTLPWQEREQLRMAGIYSALPWDLPPIDGHYAHISLKEKGMLAYTIDAKKGERDIQTIIKPGRYLTQFYPGMDPDRIRELAAQVSAMKTEIKFASTPEEIEHVYNEGPSSCMKPTSRDYVNVGDMNPVRVYGAGDLQVAYLANSFGDINARAVVWPEKKIYHRIYGDADRLKVALAELGYVRRDDWCFEGARLLRIPAGNDRVLMAFLDANPRFDIVDDKYLKISRNGPYEATRGYAATPKPTLCECGCNANHALPKQMREVNITSRRKQLWAMPCINAAVAAGRIAECGAWSEFYSIDQMAMNTIHDRRPINVSLAWIKSRGFFCDGSKRWYTKDYNEPVAMASGQTWDSRHFRDHGITIDGKNYSKESIALDRALNAASNLFGASNAQSR